MKASRDVIFKNLNKMRLLILISILLLSSCASFDGDLTKFEPLRQEDHHLVYKFTTSASLIYPLDSSDAEKTRIGWLENWLRKNGLNDKNYEILSRKAVKDNTGIFDGNYHLYYEVKTQ